MTPTHFPENVLAEADSLRVSDDILQGREAVEGITIDGPTSRDLDDALHLEYSPERFVLHISIADVSACIRSGCLLFNEAMKRVATRYVSDGNIPMLPRSVSEDALSLLEGQVRPTLTFTVTLSRELEIVNAETRKTVLKNRRKLNYAQVDYIIVNCPDDPDYQLLNDCYVLARRLMDNRRQHGALVIYDLQRLLFTNEEGQLIQMSADDAHKSNIIVQEFMILANMAVAEMAAERGYTFLFRNHTARQSTPQRAEVLEQLRTAIDNPRLLDALSKRAGLWFNRAKYEPVLKGHYGLNLPAYTHVTSPLRRMPDLLNHELLKAQLSGTDPPFTLEQLNEMAHDINSAILHAAEQKRKFFKEQTRKQTKAQVAYADATKFVNLDPNGFKRVLKEACRSYTMSEELEGVLMVRFEEKKVGVEQLAFLLFEADDGDEAWTRVRAKALETALNTTGFSDQLLHFQMQSGRLADFRIEVKEHQSGFAARIVARLDADERSTPTFAVGNNKKEAQHAAANEFLRCYLARTLVPASATTEPISMPTFAEESIFAGSGTEEDLVEENFVGHLGELCITRKSRSMPVYEFSQRGASHSPAITCTCALKVGDELKQTTGVSSNKKVAKQIAAKKMMDEMLKVSVEELVQKGIGSAEPEGTEEIIGDNYVGLLNDACMKAGWSVPMYRFAHAGPSHQPTFTCKVSVKSADIVLSAIGVAANKKIAKQVAAREMLKEIE